jgi:hypothetical protein
VSDADGLKKVCPIQSFKKNLDIEELQKTKCKLFWRQSILIPSDYCSPDKILYEIVLTKSKLYTKKINLQKFQPKFEISKVVWVIFSIYVLCILVLIYMTRFATGSYNQKKMIEVSF